MMGTAPHSLKDDQARREAISRYDRSILVEAGAGSGKTAVMAGRIAYMLAEGVAPRAIAAVTFTELAASELLIRVREFVHELAEGRIAHELRIALPQGLSQQQRENLLRASNEIDEITCSTIHGFCQRLIKPYPAEANIDPGAGIMDHGEADLVFHELVDDWLREHLSGREGGILAELVLLAPDRTLSLLRAIASTLRRRRSVKAPAVQPVPPTLSAFRRAVSDFEAFFAKAQAKEPETETKVRHFRAMADGLPGDDETATPAGLARLLTSIPHSELLTTNGTFLSYRLKGKWGQAAKAAGLSKADGDLLNDQATELYASCCASWNAISASAASHVLAALLDEAGPIIGRYRTLKRDSAQLDFDDLIFAARDLLRDHSEIRQALGQRFSHVLVDEFQDTDPLQSEIFWRLCGDPVEDEQDWTTFRIRPGALFLVGDPKQAIYRFRGADVSAYVAARDAFRAQDPTSILSISTNFRSRAPILSYVNERFEAVLSAEGQPGFTALDAFDPDASKPAVMALDIAVADENGNAKSWQQRDAEAEAIAEACARLIGSHPVIDRRTGHSRPCRPGDIALLAPTGRELWRYEEALEQRGIPVATQAGKGLYHRQEIQDLIALTRVLADRRDALALGALLRGPLVGITEEELLDIVWQLPRDEADPTRIPHLDLNVDPAGIGHLLVRDILEKLQSLARQSHSTAPFALLSQAIDVFRIRPLLLQRHRRQAERALANVDLYLGFAASYAVRGLRAFAEAMKAAWNEEARAVEGRPDAQEDAIALYTMHAAKGLEWPIVIPINTTTQIKAADTMVFDRQAGILYCPVLGARPAGHEGAFLAETEELARERVRLWYVAVTRARELLILPRPDVDPGKGTWVNLVDLGLKTLDVLDLAHLPDALPPFGAEDTNMQTRETFASEAEAIVVRQSRMTWLAPSRDETGASPRETEDGIWISDIETASPPAEAVASVQGGRERGLILHKLMEEILTGETADYEASLKDRAEELIRELGQVPVNDPALGLSPQELASCILRTIKLPEIAALRPRLKPELSLFSSGISEGIETVSAGIADVVALTEDGQPAVVIDWKSDVAPTAETLDHYRAQVSTYVDMIGAERGMVVLMTLGSIIAIDTNSI